MTHIAVIDHGAGNLVSIGHALEAAGATVRVAEVPADLEGADGVVLPGVGASGAAMARLVDVGFVEPLRRLRIPLLGICVGMQLLFSGSDEDDTYGLGLLPGRVHQIEAAPLLPHIGWNDVRPERPDPLFTGIPAGATFYFVHSFVPRALDPRDVVAVTTYGSTFPSAVRRGSICGVQFHPERSGPGGLRVLANFVGLSRARNRGRQPDAA